MNWICLFGHKWKGGCLCKRCYKSRPHKWKGCTCERCGKENHVWNYCTCKICGKTRGIGSLLSDCDYQPVADECKEKCSVCGFEREKHDWVNVCICRKCGEKRKDDYAPHDWKLAKGSTCEEKCSLCGKLRETHDLKGLCACKKCGKKNDVKGYKEHNWVLIKNECVEKCSLCGETRPKHDFNFCTCRVCGYVSHETYLHNRKFCTCLVCGEIGISNGSNFINHKWEEIPNTCKHKCEICGEINYFAFDDKRHNWVNIKGCRKKCSVCGGVAYNHSYKTISSYDGTSGGDYFNCSEKYECTVCGHKGGYGGGYSWSEEGYVTK